MSLRASGNSPSDHPNVRFADKVEGLAHEILSVTPTLHALLFGTDSALTNTQLVAIATSTGARMAPCWPVTELFATEDRALTQLVLEPRTAMLYRCSRAGDAFEAVDLPWLCGLTYCEGLALLALLATKIHELEKNTEELGLTLYRYGQGHSAS